MGRAVDDLKDRFGGQYDIRGVPPVGYCDYEQVYIMLDTYLCFLPLRRCRILRDIQAQIQHPQAA
jgi:hypothetical protein